MSDSLHAIDQAIQRHIGEISDGAVAESWVIVAHTQHYTDDQPSGYRILTSDTQPHHVDIGLLQIGLKITDASLDDAMYGGDDG